MFSVTNAGIAETTNQMEYDDEVHHTAMQKLHHLGRISHPTDPEAPQPRPWCLTVSFTHPHDPYVARRKYWDLYEDSWEEGKGQPYQPHISPIPFDRQCPQNQRIMRACDYSAYDIQPWQVASARRAYYANISYLDEKIGELLGALDAMEMRESTMVMFLADHGDMLGERGR